MKQPMVLLVAVLGCAPEPTAEPAPAPPVEIAVLAASSLTDVLPVVAAQWAAATGHEATFTFDSTSRLAKQVEAGAPADVFFSADVEWMDWLGERDLVRGDTRVNLLGNELVLVVTEGSAYAPKAAADLADPALARLALAGENVPAGKYGRATLASSGTWEAVAPRVVSGDSVRTVLGWVAAGEAPAGIVYATDARTEPRVRVAFAFPPESHPPIVYPVAVTKGATHPAEAGAFVAFCGTPEARATFEAAGFQTIGP